MTYNTLSADSIIDPYPVAAVMGVEVLATVFVVASAHVEFGVLNIRFVGNGMSSEKLRK